MGAGDRGGGGGKGDRGGVHEGCGPAPASSAPRSAARPGAARELHAAAIAACQQLTSRSGPPPARLVAGGRRGRSCASHRRIASRLTLTGPAGVVEGRGPAPARPAGWTQRARRRRRALDPFLSWLYSCTATAQRRNNPTCAHLRRSPTAGCSASSCPGPSSRPSPRCRASPSGLHLAKPGLG